MSDNRHETVLQATLAGVRDRLSKRAKLSLADDERLEGQTVLITGANRGLGFGIAELLARRGARLLLACRSEGPEAAARLIEMTGQREIEALPVDLSEHASVTALVDALADRLAGARLDRVVLNAGIVPRASRRSSAGLDLMFHVNYLAAVDVLEQLLARELIGSTHGPARVVIVSSEAHRSATASPLEQFADIGDYAMGEVLEHYGRNKLYLCAYAWELGRVLDPAKIGVFSLCPGAVASDLAREAPKWMQVLLRPTMRLLFQDPLDAARPVEWLCCARELDGQTQRYLHMHTPKSPQAWATEPEHGTELRERSLALIAKLDG